MEREKSIFVTRPTLPPMEEYMAYVARIYENRWLTNGGPILQELEAALSAYLDTPRLSLFTNGHLALETCLSSMELSGEVITTPFTFASTTHAIVRSGLTPVFCDIDPVTYTLDVNRLEKLITPRTTAIVPVHVYGNICDVDAISSIAKAHGLKVLYDAAHAFGERYLGKPVASFGDASMFSFHATKVFHTIEGGAVATTDAALADSMERRKDYGIVVGGEEIVEVGGNAKMSEFQAAMGLCNLKHLSESIAARAAVVARYRERLSGIPGLRLPHEDTHTVRNYAYFPVTFQPEVFGADRDKVRAALAERQIFARKYFYPITSAFSCYKGRFDPAATPVALEISRQVLSLPLYSTLEQTDVDRVCEIILQQRRS